MTLNLMLTSRNAVYLTGDFRVTYSNGKFRDKRDTQKLIPVIRVGWGALIAYTGIASEPRLIQDTGDWIVSTMDKIPMDGNFDEVPQRLLEANTWLSRIPRKAPLAFSVVGFTGRRPCMMLISNFLDLDGHITQPRPRLDLIERKPKQPEVRVAGDVSTVQNDEKEDLKRLLRQNAGYQLVCESLAEVNAKAAQRSNDLISRECVIGYLLPSGMAEIRPHGIGDQEPYLPAFVIADFVKNGIIGFGPKYDVHGRLLPARWVGMTAKIQGGQRKDALFAVAHVVRNVGAPIGDGVERKDRELFWKVAGANEPKHVTFKFDRVPKKSE
jgi:hypothetical protein